MRSRVIVPVVALMVATFIALGAVVATNVSATTQSIVDSQLRQTLSLAEIQLVKAKGTGPKLALRSYQTVVANFGTGSNIGVFVVDANGKIIADSSSTMLNQDVSAQGWLIGALNAKAPEFTADFGQSQIYCQSFVFDDCLLVAFIPVSELSNLLYSPLYLMGVIGLIGLILLTFLVYILITRLLVEPIEFLHIQTEGLAPGKMIDVDSVLLKRNRELVEISNSFNEVLQADFGTIDEVVQAETSPVSEVSSEAVVAPVAPSAVPVEPVVPSVVPVVPSAVPVAPSVVPQQETVAPSVVPQAEPVVLSVVPQQETARFFSSFNFPETLRSVLEHFRPALANKQIKLAVSADKRIPLSLQGDPYKMMDTVFDLLTRAITEAQIGSRVEASISLLGTPAATQSTTQRLEFVVKYADTSIRDTFEVFFEVLGGQS
jgi:hypothetical protein